MAPAQQTLAEAFAQVAQAYNAMATHPALTGIPTSVPPSLALTLRQLIHEELQPLRDGQQQLLAKVERMEKQMERMQQTLPAYSEASATPNTTLTLPTVTAQDVPIRDRPAPDLGPPPPDFPATVAELRALTRDQLEVLLQAYNQPVPPETEERRNAFACFIGVRLT